MAALLLAGCGSDASDAGELENDGHLPPSRGGSVVDTPELGSLQLEILSTRRVWLGFSERAPIKVRVRDQDGVELPDVRVHFAIVGRSQDAGLAKAEAITDLEGIAENELTTGGMVASFAVRVSTPGAFDEWISVAVSDAGFGTLLVQAPYVGPRTMTQRTVYALANMDCESAERMAGDPMTTLGPRESLAEFLVLPAASRYAVLAEVEGQKGFVVARGCVDRVAVRPNGIQLVWVRFQNLPLVTDGDFPVAIELDTRAPARTIGRALEGAVQTLVNTDEFGNSGAENGEARLLLDALDSTLRSGSVGAAALADAVAADRATPSLLGTPEQNLQALLDFNREGALSVVRELASLTTADTQKLRLYATIVLEPADGLELPLRLRVRRVEALGASSKTVRASLDLGDRDSMETEATRSEVGDTIALSRAQLALPFGALGVQVLREVVSFGAAGHGAEIRAGIGCASLADWLAAQDYAQAASCDEHCVQMACDRAVEVLTSAAATALNALSESRPTFTLTGDFELADEDGDLSPESLSSARLSGEWDPAEGDARGDAVSGTAATVGGDGATQP